MAAHQETNWMSLIPRIKMEWTVNPENDNIIIKKPKFKHPLLKKYLLPRLKQPDFKVNLDEIGSFVWRQIDGKRSLLQIADLMKEKFADRVEPVNDRLIQFVTSLSKHGFIGLYQSDSSSSVNHSGL